MLGEIIVIGLAALSILYTFIAVAFVTGWLEIESKEIGETE